MNSDLFTEKSTCTLKVQTPSTNNISYFKAKLLSHLGRMFDMTESARRNQ
jgi:hypothetical protein